MKAYARHLSAAISGTENKQTCLAKEATKGFLLYYSTLTVENNACTVLEIEVIDTLTRGRGPLHVSLTSRTLGVKRPV
jgi:hypothetical protein